MKKPEIPLNEIARLTTLRSLNLLDTPEEERFNRLTRLAKRMFDVPIALVSIVDENRQWFKSCQGLNTRETPRDISFCGHAILGDAIFIVPDTTQDPRFADNPLVLNDPKIRFYAGCPIRYIDGSKLGTLCIIDQKPRTFNQEEIESLKDLAELTERELAAFQLATLDDLTKISNRRGFIMLAQNSLHMSFRQEIPASLVFFDLKKFKQINDNYGHAEGDKALIVFAEKMIETFRDSDVFGRIGGDEFVLLLTNTTIENVDKILKVFRESLEKHSKESQSDYVIKFSHGTLSIEKGCKLSIEELLKKADSLMYENKSQSN